MDLTIASPMKSVSRMSRGRNAPKTRFTSGGSRYCQNMTSNASRARALAVLTLIASVAMACHTQATNADPEPAPDAVGASVACPRAQELVGLLTQGEDWLQLKVFAPAKLPRSRVSSWFGFTVVGAAPVLRTRSSSTPNGAEALVRPIARTMARRFAIRKTSL